MGGKPRLVVATALGPDWLRVTSVLRGQLGPDAGIGAVPRGTPSLEALWAGRAVEHTAWARTNRVATAFCFGVGPYEEMGQDVYRFAAYSCSTYTAARRRGPQVLAAVTGDDAVRIVGTLAR